MSYADRCRDILERLAALQRDIEAERKTADARLSKLYAKHELTAAEDAEADKLEDAIDEWDNRIDAVDRACAALSCFR